MSPKQYCINCLRRAIDRDDIENERYHTVCDEHPNGGHSGCQCPAAQAPGR